MNTIGWTIHLRSNALDLPGRVARLVDRAFGGVLRSFGKSVSVRLLLATALACFGGMHVQAQFVGANPRSGHSLSSCSINDGMGGITNSYEVDGPGLVKALTDGCVAYAKAHSTGGNTDRFDSCTPDLPLPSGGGEWASFSIKGTNTLTRNSDGAVLQQSSGSWSLGTCGCASNQGAVGVGTDGQCYCYAPNVWDKDHHACVPRLDRYHDKRNTCAANYSVGKPIFPLTGSKGLNESLGKWTIAGRSVSLIYETRRKVPADRPDAVFDQRPMASFGELWSTTLHKNLVVATAGGRQVMNASRGGGAWVTFTRDPSGGYFADADVMDRLVSLSGGWRYYDAGALAMETYDGQGKLLNVAYADGSRLTYVYSDASTPSAIAPTSGLLIAVQDHTGRSLSFQYEQPAGIGSERIRAITTPDATTIGVAYDASGNLVNVTWPDGKSRRFVYERADFPWAVTGIFDENVVRLATYGYDLQGRAIETQWAGGAFHYKATYTTPPSWSIADTYDESLNIIWRDHYWQVPQGLTLTGPNGNVGSAGAVLVQGMPYLVSQTQPAGSGCSASTSHQSFDAQGSLLSKDDFNGTRTCYLNETGRHLEMARVEGLMTTSDCGAVDADKAVLPTGSRKVSTKWHPDWSLPNAIAAPKNLTQSVYQGQPDPTVGNALASCAPSEATMPDGKPIPVLCKRIEQATTDVDGSLGFSATIDSSVPSKTWTYTYNQYGQVLTAKGPRTDVNDTTTYVYYADTTADHTLGDLQSVTNAAGHQTRYTKYDKAGRVLQSIDATGVTTDITYKPRGWVASVSVTPSGGGTAQVTTYSYDAVGQLKQVNMPDGTNLQYTYDDAHRLSQVKDQAGNTMTYTLDNAGNRTGEALKDASGSLVRNIIRVFDALGRLQQQSGASL